MGSGVLLSTGDLDEPRLAVPLPTFAVGVAADTATDGVAIFFFGVAAAAACLDEKALFSGIAANLLPVISAISSALTEVDTTGQCPGMRYRHPDHHCSRTTPTGKTLTLAQRKQSPRDRRPFCLSVFLMWWTPLAPFVISVIHYDAKRT